MVVLLLTVLLLSFQFPPVQAADYFCHICGEGFRVTAPDAIVTIPTQPDRSCQDLLDANEKGNISEFNCGLLQAFVRQKCQCARVVATSAPTPSPSPAPTTRTNRPTSSPTTSPSTSRSPSSTPTYRPSVLTKFPTFSPTASPSVAPTQQPVLGSNDLIDVSMASGTFSILLAALQAANLVEALSEPMGPFTIFAPLDIAFERLPEGAVDALLTPENSDWLTEILLYHIVPGSFASWELVDGSILPTLHELVSEAAVTENAHTNAAAADDVVRSVSSFLLEIGWNGTMVTLNHDAANVVRSDILASNGYIHAISDILIPPDFELFLMMTDITNATDGNETSIIPPPLGANETGF
jgi:uncharacterized surface protein with fasciclin (FAS1) repeats